MQIIQRNIGSEQSASSANASVLGEVEAYTIGQLISSSMQNSSQPPEQHLLVPHVQAQQEIITSQETELTSVKGNNSAPTLTRSQSYSTVEQERNNRLLAEQHSVLPAAETTQAAPTIRVTIGRIDVRAIPGPAPAPSSKQARRSPALSLDDYLKQGKGGRQ